jgi:multidrug efflux pump subunit AcrB
MRSILLVLATLVLTTAGCLNTAGEGPVVVVTASYPGANAGIVADTVAAPIEQQVNGVEGMVRMESESRNDGTYVACVRFKRGADPDIASVLVQNRVALAMPMMPDAVKRVSAAVKIRAEKEGGRDRVTIAIVDRGGHGWNALRGFSEAVLKRLSADGAIVKPETFPGPDEDQLHVDFDRKKCTEHGVAITEAFDAVQTATSSAKINEWKSLRIKSSKGDTVPLNAIAEVKVVKGPSAVYRVDMYQAVRITDSATEGHTARSAALRCVGLADDERKDQKDPHGFAVIDLTAQ